jgi:hypothetical protein
LFEKSNAFKKEEIIPPKIDVATSVVRAETKEEKPSVIKSTIEMTISNPKNLIIFVSSIIFLIVITIVIVVINSGKSKNNKEIEAKSIYVSPEQEMQTLKIVARAKSDSWMKARYGDKEEDFILKKGQTKEWKDIDKIVFLVGNAAGIEFNVNGEAIGTIGEEGEVINGLVFQAGKNWYIDRNQGFKKDNKPNIQNTTIPVANPTAVSQNQDTKPLSEETKTTE